MMNGTGASTAPPRARKTLHKAGDLGIPSLTLHFRVEHPAWKKDRASLKKLAHRACRQAVEKTKRAMEFSLILADDTALQRLNASYRGKDKPTNVLSFPSGEEEQTGYWGDVIISMDTVEKEAAAQGKLGEHHLAHLMVHGLLHLQGYDHETDPQAAEMEGLEVEILKEINIPHPYL